MKKGDCYETAAKALLENTQLMLCHGKVTGQGKLAGKRIDHAWNELNGFVLDFSNGKSFCVGKEAYYLLGKVNETEVKRYDLAATAKMLCQTKHFGPWEAENGT